MKALLGLQAYLCATCVCMDPCLHDQLNVKDADMEKALLSYHVVSLPECWEMRFRIAKWTFNNQHQYQQYVDGDITLIAYYTHTFKLVILALSNIYMNVCLCSLFGRAFTTPRVLEAAGADSQEDEGEEEQEVTVLVQFPGKLNQIIIKFTR